jgi:hypothetical protein
MSYARADGLLCWRRRIPGCPALPSLRSHMELSFARAAIGGMPLLATVAALSIGGAPAATADGHSHCNADSSSYRYADGSSDCTSGYHLSTGEHVTGHGGYISSNQVCVANLTPSGGQAGMVDCTTSASGSAAQTYGRQNALARNKAASGNTRWIDAHGIWYD